MGIAGAALATILSQLISALLVLTVLMKQPREGKLKLKQIRFHKNLLFSMLRIGIPAGIQLMMHIVLWNTIFIPIEVLAGTMRGTGYALPPTVIMCVCVCLFRILWILLAVEQWHTIFALCLAYPIS